MVHLVRFFSAAAIVTVSSAVPMVRRDSVVGSELPVSAPSGIPMTDSSALTATAAPMASSMPMASMPPPMASSMPMDSMPPPMASSMSMDSMPPPMASSMPMASMPPPMASMPPPMASMPPPMASPMPYGSGSSSWGSGYDSCVQQCAASHPMPSMVWTPSATQSSGSSGGSSGGSGVTHTVIVAPSQGVLRYIPFSTNASVGDTVAFVWHAGPHTVTQSSALEVCNKTSAPGAFASGQQNSSFVFNEVINNTNPIWFYCGVPNHCQKGMFGGVNIGQSDPTMSSGATYIPLSSMMMNLTTMNPDMSGMWTVTKSKTANNPYADTWGMNTNCAGMGQSAVMETAKNIMYMQTLIASNPQAIKNGTFAVGNASNLTIPADLFAASGMNSSMTTSSAAASASTAASPAAASSTAKPNGAGSITSSSVVVGLVAIIATFYAL